MKTKNDLKRKIEYLKKTNEELGHKLEMINKIIEGISTKAGNLKPDVEVIPIDILEVVIKEKIK